MKTIQGFVMAILLMATNGDIFGRVGETREQIAARYGTGQRSDIQRLEGAETMKYQFKNFQVEVVFDERGNSIWEIFKRQDKSIDGDDVRTLLGANSREDGDWRFYRLENRWRRSGDGLLIAYYWPGHEDFFCVEDPAACEAIQNGPRDRDLKGF